MPKHYQYQGKHYELPDGLSNEEALAKIKNHLGESSPDVADAAAPQGWGPARGGNPWAASGSAVNLPFSSATGALMSVPARDAQDEQDIEGGVQAASKAGAITGMVAPTVPQAIMHPFLTGKALGLSVVGGSVGGAVGSTLGTGLERAGFPAGTSQAGGTLGGLVGSVAGPIGGTRALMRLRAMGGGPGGQVAGIVEGLLSRKAASAATTGESATVGALLKGTPGRSQQAAGLLKLRLEARKLTIRERALEVAAERNRIKVLQLESKAGRAGKAKVLPDGQRAMGTSRGGTARPGPAPTPPDQLEATLRASVEAGKTPKPFDASMSSAQRAPVSPAAANQLETAMVKGEGPGSIPYALGKRSHGPGDIPQMSELMQNVDDIAHNSDVPVAMSKRLLSWLQKASTPAGKVTTRETGLARATVPRRKLLEEYIDIMKDPQWETVFGSDELLRHGTKLEIKLDALRTIEKAMAR